ncbi:MAG TPA: benzoate-CoA ligase family protein [Actinospica sp.]|jgi:benzoate-CoA ligase family protein|nr:benzoate-CoA ligase family protein [Actinospica sp.]
MNEVFNACSYLLDRHLETGGGDRIALTTSAGGDVTYRALHERVVRTAAGLRASGLQPEQRVLMYMADSPEFVTVFLAAMRIGAIPVPVSTMLHADGLADLLRDSHARFLAVSGEFSTTAAKAVAQAQSPDLVAVLSGDALTTLARHEPLDAPYPTTADSPAFWLYTSGTTGTPKAAMHRHGSIRVVCETYGEQVLGIRAEDRCLSAAKAFFAYGLGNSVLFPLAAGATAILEPAPSRPQTLVDRARELGATLFFAGPTFFANMLHTDLPADALSGVRLSASAGEPLPEALYRRWTQHFGIDILDGIGMTEMLHIFLSNREGAVHPGTTGVAVPGYDLRILDDEGHEVSPGTPGTLHVRGASMATGYWSRYAATQHVFQGEWLCTGDTYVQDAEGYYACLGRTGDMIKASGMWVAPAEVETRLLQHPAIDQAAVVATVDADGLEKPVAYVVLAPSRSVRPAQSAQSALEDELIEFCREGLPSFKRPRRVIFLDALPTTATGKVRRVELRAAAVGLLGETP